MSSISETENLVQPTTDKFSRGSNRFSTISARLQRLLQGIVDDVVDRLGCVGAVVTTLEIDNSLPTRAYSVSLEPRLLRNLESRLDGVFRVGPNSVVYLDDEQFKDNLSVRAVKGLNGQPEVVVSDRLYDLFRPMVDEPLSDLAQELAGIKQVIAVPFFLRDEVVGNLLAATGQEFSRRDIDFLTAFGKQAAIAIQSQRHLSEVQTLERVILSLQSSITDETEILQTIVDAVVQKLGYAGAIVASLGVDNTLSVRAYAVDVSSSLFNQFEEKLRPSLIDSHAIVFLDDEHFKDNLGVRAINRLNNSPEVIVTDSLYDLLRPVVDKPLSDFVQERAGIKKIIAVPFSLEDEVVGNLFVATRKQTFSEREKEVLITFGQQAAVGLRNALIYHKAEERRQIAQLFGKMAFSAAAYIHSLRNHIGASLNYLQLLAMMPQLPQAQRSRLLDLAPEISVHLGKAIDIVDNLHKPWHQRPDVPTDVNSCLDEALRKIFPIADLTLDHTELSYFTGVVVHRHLTKDLPLLQTSPDMLTEAFRILIKNATEAIGEKSEGGDLWIESHLNSNSVIEVIIRDNGAGIKPEDLNQIFDLGWSTKRGTGMGFGLFWTEDYLEGLGGSIKVESVWQKGTTFCINIPASINSAVRE